MNLSIIRFIFCLRELQEPGQRVLDPKVDWVDQQVGEKEEEVCTTKAGQEMVEDVPHRPVKFFLADCNSRFWNFQASKLVTDINESFNN